MSDEIVSGSPDAPEPGGDLPERRVPDVPDVHALPRTADLDDISARAITSANATRLIVIAGLNGSGKTTLVASTYDRFLRGFGFAGYIFASSETLIGFEQRVHLSRLASGLTHPETERTPFSESMRLLHLRLRKANGGPFVDVLFTDIFGEAFRQAKDSTDACRRLTFLRRADHVVVLLDGEQLLDGAARISAVASVDDFLQRSLDSGMLGKQTHVDIATTKWDVVERCMPEMRAGVHGFLATIESRCQEDFRSSFASLRLARVAARPAPPSLLASAYGVDVLFPAWVEEERVPSVTPVDWRGFDLPTEFDRYVLRAGYKEA
jgi:hypothetical protein